MEFYSHFERVADPPNFLRKLALKLVETCRLLSSDNRPIGLRIYSKYGKIPMLRLWFLFIFYHIPEDYSVDNYSIWCIRKIFYLHLSIPRAQANTVQHTYLIVVSITEIIEYYKNGYMSATVGTRLHLASG